MAKAKQLRLTEKNIDEAILRVRGQINRDWEIFACGLLKVIQFCREIDSLPLPDFNLEDIDADPRKGLELLADWCKKHPA